MDDSWRFRRIQSNICPVCSTSHFPFCPPPPAFGYLAGDAHRRFSPDLDPTPFHRQAQDPPPFHRQAQDPPPFHRQAQDPPPFHHHAQDPPPFHRQAQDPPPFHRQIQDTPPFQNQVRDTPLFHLQVQDTPPFQNEVRDLPPFHRSTQDPLPFHRPVQDPLLLDHRNPPFPPFPLSRDPNPQPPFHSSSQFLHEEFSDRDRFQKRMRVEDLYPLPPPVPPPHQRIYLDDERRLSLIREHGHQDSAFADHSFNSAPIHQNQHLQGNAFHGYRKFEDFPRSQGFDRVLAPQKTDLYGGEVENVRTGASSSQVGSSWSRSEENYMNRASGERQFLDSRPPFAHDRQFYLDESSSFALPKQPQYRHSESYHVMPKVANDEQESHYPPAYHSMRLAPLGDKLELQNHFELKPPVFEEIRKPFAPHANPMPHKSNDYGIDPAVIDRTHTSQMYPPLPSQPPLPPPPEPSPPHFQDKPLVPMPHPMLSPVPATSSAPLFPTQPTASAPLFPTQPTTSSPLFPTTSSHLFPTQPTTSSPLFPTQPATSAPLFPTQPNSQSSLESRPLVQSNFYNEMPGHTSTGFVTEGLPFIHQTPLKECMEERRQTFRHSLNDKPAVIDACHLFRQPHRASRPDHIVVILRGLPGSGKSYLAKALRDLEVESGGNAPRIHAMDDYFMIEVEKKVEESEGSKSSGSFRGKKQISKKVIEYCYEPEMEEAYRSSMLKAFKKTLDEGNFTFIIVDDRNLRVADFAQFWAVAKRSGYEVYLLEATYKDPTGCAARNVHGFTVEDIQKMAEQWEEAPPLYLQLDIQSLFHGDNLNEQSIQEVDMDTDDAACDEEETHKLQQSEDTKIANSISSKQTLDGFAKIGERWNTDDDEEEEEPIGVKDLGRSKWSKDVDEDVDNSDGAGGNLSALSGLIQAYGKSEKSVHWGDQVEQIGFSIGAVKKQGRSSLIIGPGSGYNLSSNPTREDDGTLQPTGKSNINESKSRFTEKLRAERESFKAVFDRRRQRIGGLLDAEDE